VAYVNFGLTNSNFGQPFFQGAHDWSFLDFFFSLIECLIGYWWKINSSFLFVIWKKTNNVSIMGKWKFLTIQLIVTFCEIIFVIFKCDYSKNYKFVATEHENKVNMDYCTIIKFDWMHDDNSRKKKYTYIYIFEKVLWIV